MAKKDELPQELTDRIAREENEQDRNMIIKPAKKVYNAIKNSTVVDELSRGVKRIGQDLGITKDENQYEDKARMDSIRKAVNSKKAGGKVSSASSRGDGIAQRGKTRGRMV